MPLSVAPDIRGAVDIGNDLLFAAERIIQLLPAVDSGDEIGDLAVIPDMRIVLHNAAADLGITRIANFAGVNQVDALGVVRGGAGVLRNVGHTVITLAVVIGAEMEFLIIVVFAHSGQDGAAGGDRLGLEQFDRIFFGHLRGVDADQVGLDIQLVDGLEPAGIVEADFENAGQELGAGVLPVEFDTHGDIEQVDMRLGVLGDDATGVGEGVVHQLQCAGSLADNLFHHHGFADGLISSCKGFGGRFIRKGLRDDPVFPVVHNEIGELEHDPWMPERGGNSPGGQFLLLQSRLLFSQGDGEADTEAEAGALGPDDHRFISSAGFSPGNPAALQIEQGKSGGALEADRLGGLDHANADLWYAFIHVHLLQFGR